MMASLVDFVLVILWGSRRKRGHHKKDILEIVPDTESEQ